MAPFADVLGVAAALTGVLALGMFVVAVASARKAGRAAFYATRREGGRSATRKLAMSLGLFVLSGIFWVGSLISPRDEIALQPQPALQTPFAVGAATIATRTGITSTLARAPTDATASSTPLRAATSAAVASPNAPASPLPTPLTTAAPALTSSVALTEATLKLRAIATGVGAGGQALNAGTEFSRGVRTIYVWFDQRDVAEGTRVTHEWVLSGESLIRLTDALSPTIGSTGVVSWSSPGGFAPGLYEVRFSIGEARAFVANFMVR